MSLDNIESTLVDGWHREIDIDIRGHQHAVVVVMAAGFDDPATDGLPRSEQRAVMVELAQVLGLLPTPAPAAEEVEALLPGMVLEAARTGTPGRQVRLLVRHDSGVWVVSTVRHPQAPARVGKQTTFREASLRRDWRVVSRGPVDGSDSGQDGGRS